MIITLIKKIIKGMNKSYQNKVIKDTKHLRPKPNYPTYPPYHEGMYIEDYFFDYFTKNKIETDRIYIPIFWTSCYNNHWYTGVNHPNIQSYLNSLNPDLKYFTICQHERAPEEILPKNTIVYSASGKIFEKNRSNNYKSIPLICSKIKDPNKDKKRDIFCSFVGANTHEIRRKLDQQLKDDKNYYFEMSGWEINIPKHKEINFKDITERSVFTLCPRGDGPTSFRMYEAMQLGSIPVYVYNVKWIPYEKELNWIDLCVFVNENEISHIKDILENIPQERIDFMRSKISDIYDEWFSLDRMCQKIISNLNNEKMRLLTFFSDSHDILFKNYFKPSVDKINEYDLVVEKFDQIGVSGAYFEKGWKESMLEKLKFLVKTVNECWGDNFVFSDADVIFIDKTRDFLIKNLNDKDAAFQFDYNGLCAGFFIMKASQKSLDFLNKCIDTYDDYPDFDDQNVMRVHEKLLNYKLLPNEIFNISMINGGNVWDGELNFDIPKNIIAFHANWTIGVKAKIDLFNLVIDNLIETKDITFLKRKNDDTSFYRFDDDSLFVGIVKSGRMISGNYLKRENEILLSDNKNSNKKLKVNVYFNYFESKTEKRSKEILYCLNKLISNTKIDRIYLLCSDEYTEWLDKKVIKIDIFNLQPTFNDIFNIVNFNTKTDDLNIILNSDCFIDEENVQLILDNIKHKMVYCLSRWNISNINPFKAEHYDLDCSQDAWIFLGEIDDIKGNFKMGMPGCDNAIAYEFDNAGYITLNPSKDIKIYHYHFSDVRTYGNEHEEKEKNRVRRTYKFIPSSSLTDDIKEESKVVDKIKEIQKPVCIDKNVEVKKTKSFKENILNSFVDNVYCVNLRRRKDKLSHMMDQFKKLDLDSFQVIRATDGEKLKLELSDKRKHEIAFLKSYIGVLQDAIDKDYDKIAIFDDDIVFCDDFESRFEYYIKSVPEDWEILYFGNDIPVMFNPISMIKLMIYRVWRSKGCFAMILNNRDGLFKKIIDLCEKEENSIDIYLDSILSKIKAYTFIPFFVKISSDFKSDLEKNADNINKHFKETVVLPIIIPQPVAQPQKIIIKTQKEMCEEHLKLKGNFMVYYNNLLVFDSSASSKENILFLDEHFEVFGRNFPYRGMFIKRK